MDILNTVTEKGVVEQRFDLKVGSEAVPGILWRPEGVQESRPTVLIGHGGTQHKRAPNVLALARRLVRHLGYAAVALDAPGHGERVTDQAAADEARRNLTNRIASGRREGAPSPMQLSPDQARAWLSRTTNGGAEWKALLDNLPGVGLGDGPYGYWGVSMGTMIGLPFVASEPRITCAVLGLAGMNNRLGGNAFEQAARSLTIPVLFVCQSDDELMTRDSALALWDALGSKDKTMHINPGGHVGIPPRELDSFKAFFVRHLGTTG